jgi:DNA modification methylase
MLIEGTERLTETVTLHLGDCVAVLATLDANSIDSIVTDPPYGLEFMGKEWDGSDGFRRSLNEADVGRANAFWRMSARAPEYRTAGTGQKSKPGIGERDTEWVNNQGWNQFRCEACGHLFHGGSPCQCADPKPVRADNRWHLFQAWCEVWARECLRVLKPGGHALIFGGSRTYHRMACAVEDSGFEVRDQIQWLYGSGFPKSLNVSKAIDKAAGAEREVVGKRQFANGTFARDGAVMGQHGVYSGAAGHPVVTAPATDAARQWEGYGTALKPACEPIVLARKPLIGTVADNVLKHGTGALNIDGCRVAGTVTSNPLVRNARGFESNGLVQGEVEGGSVTSDGRWPANVITDGSDEVVRAFPDVHGAGHARAGSSNPERTNYDASAYHISHDTGEMHRFGDEGSAARFFYTAKADSEDRAGSKHPTVKPVDLMAYLIRLVTPKGGTVLDPFAGTGTVGEAAFREGVRAILIEREPEYQEDIRRRMRLATTAGPDERAREAMKARMKDKPADHGPLFGGLTAAGRP